MFRIYASFDGEDLSAPRPTPQPEDHPLSAVRDCLFYILAATLHIGGRSSILNPRTRHAVMTDSLIMEGKHLSDVFPIKNGLKQGDALSPVLLKL